MSRLLIIGKPVKTYKLGKNEYGVVNIKALNIPSETIAYVVNRDGTIRNYGQLIKSFSGGGWISCIYHLPLLPGINDIQFHPKHLTYRGKDYTTIKYNIQTLKNCEPHSVRELKIHKSSVYTISYDKPAIGIFKLKRPLYQQNASGCTSLAGGNIVTGWIAVKFPGSYCVVTGSGYRILPKVHPFNIIDVSLSKLYVKKEEKPKITIQHIQKPHTTITHKTHKPNVTTPKTHITTSKPSTHTTETPKIETKKEEIETLPLPPLLDLILPLLTVLLMSSVLLLLKRLF